MVLQDWSETICVAELQDDPLFTDDIVALIDQVKGDGNLNAVLDFSNVNYLNSSNIARMIDLRNQVVDKNKRRMVMCGVNTQVWGIFLVSELHKMFDFYDNVAEGLTAIQIELPSD